MLYSTDKNSIVITLLHKRIPHLKTDQSVSELVSQALACVHLNIVRGIWILPVPQFIKAFLLIIQMSLQCRYYRQYCAAQSFCAYVKLYVARIALENLEMLTRVLHFVNGGFPC